jgi:hypothetical protein
MIMSLPPGFPDGNDKGSEAAISVKTEGDTRNQRLDLVGLQPEATYQPLQFLGIPIQLSRCRSGFVGAGSSILYYICDLHHVA